jgi:hypothetical protein
MRPGALGQVLDHHRDAAVALHEQHVTLADVALETVEMVPAVPLVARQRLGEQLDELTCQPASKAQVPSPGFMVDIAFTVPTGSETIAL